MKLMWKRLKTEGYDHQFEKCRILGTGPSGCNKCKNCPAEKTISRLYDHLIYCKYKCYLKLSTFLVISSLLRLDLTCWMWMWCQVYTETYFELCQILIMETFRVKHQTFANTFDSSQPLTSTAKCSIYNSNCCFLCMCISIFEKAFHKEYYFYSVLHFDKTNCNLIV